jgi:hypothetical protein
VEPTGALAAPQATNYALRSKEFDHAIWTSVAATGGGTGWAGAAVVAVVGAFFFQAMVATPW